MNGRQFVQQARMPVAAELLEELGPLDRKGTDVCSAGGQQFFQGQQAFGRSDHSQANTGQSAGIGRVGHAAAAPRAPVDAQPWQSLRSSGSTQGVHKRIGRGIIGLPRRPNQRGNRREADKIIERQVASLLVQVPASVYLSWQHFGEPLPRLLRKRGVV